MSAGANSTPPSAGQQKVRIVSWPKMFFLYPTIVVSFVLCLAQAMVPIRYATLELGSLTEAEGAVASASAEDAKVGAEGAPKFTSGDVFAVGMHRAFGLMFMFILGMNLIVLTFEFPRANSLIAFLTVGLVFLVLVVLSLMNFPIFRPLSHLIWSLDLRVSTQFYAVFAFYGAVLYAGMYIYTRFDYWELSPNELIRHRGLLGDIQRYSTNGLKLNKEISDIFEFWIAGAGTLVLTLPSEPRPIVLDNVLGIDPIQKKADILLNAQVVRIESVEAVSRQLAQAEKEG